MVYCTNCSRKLNDNAKFCIYCGTRRNISTQSKKSNYRATQNRATSNRPAVKKQGIGFEFSTKKVIPKSITIKTNRPKSNRIQTIKPQKISPKKNIIKNRNISTQRTTRKKQNLNSNHSFNDSRSVVTQKNISQSRQVETNQTNPSPELMDHDLYQLNQRIALRLDTIKNTLKNFYIRDEFSRSDATLINRYIQELKSFQQDNSFNRSKYFKETNDIVYKINLIAINIYENLTSEIDQIYLNDLRSKWGKYNKKIADQLATKELLDELEKQNKIINRQINKFEKFFGSPTYIPYPKSQLFIKYPRMRNYYITSLGPVIKEYLIQIENNVYASYFDKEVEILNELRSMVDPNIINRKSFSTMEISTLCFDFIEERGVNSSRLRLQLGDLEEDLIKDEKNIKKLQKEYTNLMWEFINKEQLAIADVNTIRGKNKASEKPIVHEKTAREELINYDLAKKINLSGLQPPNDLNDLEDLVPFAALDDLK